MKKSLLIVGLLMAMSLTASAQYKGFSFGFKLGPTFDWTGSKTGAAINQGTKTGFDLGVVAEMADYVVVMYAGRVVEKGTATEIFKDPRHPYTIGLMNSKPVVGKHVDKLYSIPGNVPNPIDMPNYCYFKDRCEMCTAKCSGAYPKTYKVSPTHEVACYRCEEGGLN